uniref:Uncharacterized protein n=1 Tax=Zea mays TaxID=4577 RepID=A0A804LWG5_MAIZE
MAQAPSHPLAPHRGPPSIALPPPASPAVPSSTIPLTSLQSHPAPIPTALAATPEDSPSNRPSPSASTMLLSAPIRSLRASIPPPQRRRCPACSRSPVPAMVPPGRSSLRRISLWKRIGSSGAARQ